jgi:hypothetical protein
MDTLIVILIVSLAVAFTTELLSFIFSWVPVLSKVNAAILTFPVSMGYYYILGTTYPDFLVNSAATAFLALTFGIIVERVNTEPLEIRRGRRG